MAFDGAISARKPNDDFDALCCSAGHAAQEAHTLLMAAFFCEGAVRSATLARQALTHFDEMAPLVAQLRAKLGRANPHAEG